MPYKPGSVGSLNMYLGTKLKQMQVHNNIWFWSMSPFRFFMEAVKICKEYVTKYLSRGYSWQERAENPFTISYLPIIRFVPSTVSILF